LLRREVIPQWGGRSIHEISKRHIIELVMEVAARGTPSAANKLHKVVKTFFTWCIGRAILDLSPAKGVAAPARERARERVLHDEELVRVIRAARQINGPYGGIVELLALTGQRREEVAQLTWDELDLTSRAWTIPASRTKNGKSHIVHLSKEAIAGGIDERMGGGPRWRMTNANPSERSSVMKLPSQLVERTLSQFEAEALPDNHPAVEQLNQLFGDHTFLLDGNGLHIIEPAEPTETGAQAGVIVKLASWNDSSRTSLAPHSPEPTDLIIVLEAA
jgi:Phage integrase family